MAYISKTAKDRMPLGPIELAEFDLAITIPAGVSYTTVALGGATNNIAYLARLRGENGDGNGNPVKLYGSATAVVAYLNQANIAAPSPLLSQFSEYGNWSLATSAFTSAGLLNPLIKTTATTPTVSYAGFDKNGVNLGINSNPATVSALPGFAKLVTIWPIPVLVDDATVTNAASPKTVNATLTRNASNVEAGSAIQLVYPYATAVNANDRVGTAGKA